MKKTNDTPDHPAPVAFQRACALVYGITMISVVSDWSHTAIGVVVGVSYILADLICSYFLTTRMYRWRAALADVHGSQHPTTDRDTTGSPQAR